MRRFDPLGVERGGIALEAKLAVLVGHCQRLHGFGQFVFGGFLIQRQCTCLVTRHTIAVTVRVGQHEHRSGDVVARSPVEPVRGLRGIRCRAVAAAKHHAEVVRRRRIALVGGPA